jgi:hypothetical protein
VEALAIAIRENPRIEGITINGITFKIGQYADDTVLYLKNQESLKIALSILELFSKCTGLCMNREKSESVWIGASSNYLHKPFGLKWTQKPIKTLGIYISNSKKEMLDINYNERLNKVETLTNLWKLRKLTLKGKILINNTLLLPQLLYVSTILETPDWVVKRYNDIIRDFVWEGKPSKIKHTCLINSIEEGGLKLQSMETKVASLKFKWVKKILDDSTIKPWKAYLEYKVKESTEYVFLGNLSLNDMPIMTDKFYASIFETWAKLNHYVPQTVEEMLKQMIWKNSFIKIANKTVYFKVWCEKGIMFIQDLLNSEGHLADKIDLENKYDINIKFLEYESLMHSLPKTWKQQIENDTGSKNMIMYKECKIKINSIFKKLPEISTKDIYWELITQIAERPTSEATWQKHTELNLTKEEWKIIYTMPYSITRDTKLINFNFKITHRILAVGEKLKKWKIKDSDRCNICGEFDNIEHFLVTCPTVLTFWQYLFNWWEANNKTKFPLLVYEIIFGIPNENKEVMVESFNYILLCANYYIYISKKKEKQLDLYEFLLDVKNRLIIEIKIVEDKNASTGNKRWGILKEILGID